MTINVNNQSQSISENTSVYMLLKHLNIATNGIAIAINNEIITKERWDRAIVEENDNITIIKATQGG